MKIDMTVLRGLEREKEISFDLVVGAIETALLTAYRHTEGAQPHARVELDRTTGEVAVLAQELGRTAASCASTTTPPRASAGSPASTAKQVILQRLREAESAQSYGEYAGREGDIVSGTVQQAPQRPGAPPNRNVHVLIGSGDNALEAVLPATEQVPGEVYAHGTRLKCRVVSVGPWSAQRHRHRLAHPPRPRPRAVRARGARDRRRLGRDRGHRPRGRPPQQDRRAVDVPGLNAKGACIGPVGSRVRAVTTELHGEKIDIVDWAEDPPASWRARCRRPASAPSRSVDAVLRSARVVVPDYQLSLAIGKEGQNARLAARLTGWRIDIHSDAE
jgi:N utilization substance protein A